MTFTISKDDIPVVYLRTSKRGLIRTCHACGNHFVSEEITLTCTDCCVLGHNDFYFRGKCPVCNAENISLRRNL